MAKQDLTRKASGIASIIAAATAVAVYTPTANRVFVVRKMHIRNRTAGTVIVTLGTGVPPAAFVPILPGLQELAGMHDLVEQGQIIEVPLAVPLSCQSSAAGAAPNDVQISVEVEEFQGV